MQLRCAIRAEITGGSVCLTNVHVRLFLDSLYWAVIDLLQGTAGCRSVTDNKRPLFARGIKI